MEKNGERQELAKAVKGLFEEMHGESRAKDFMAVADLLGFDVRVKEVGEREIEEICHQQQLPGEGFWSAAPGAGDISEGMVWVSKKPTS